MKPVPSPPATPVWDFAFRLGWSLQPGINLILEGTTDVEYFRLADEYSRETNRLKLLGDGFHVVAGPKDSPSAGTKGILDYFPALSKMASLYFGVLV